MTCERKIGPYDCCSVVQGDCLELMKALPDGCVDIVLTSPPWNVDLDYDTYRDDKDEGQFFISMGLWLQESFRCSADSGRMYAIVGDKMLWEIRDLAEKAKWTFAQLLAWGKPNFSGGCGRIAGDWNNMTEWILLFRKGKRTPMLNGESTTHNFFVIPSPQSNWIEGKEHPAQWPVQLPYRLLSRTPGEFVLDPFAGSGVGLQVAAMLKRHFLGFEISEEYCRIARERIALVEAQPSLFEKQPEQLEFEGKA